MPIAVQGICDLEVRIGKEKISLGSVVIADIDFQCPELLLDARTWLADCFMSSRARCVFRSRWLREHGG